jgi:hypothetical protein
MSEALVNQITLDCLLNKKQYEKYVAKQVSKTVKEEDKKRYKKRLCEFTKELLSSKEDREDLPMDVKYSFDQYIKTCIHYFNTIDNHERIQKEYTTIEKKELEEETIIEERVQQEKGEEQEQSEEEKRSKASSDIRIIRSFHVDPFITKHSFR